MACNGNCYSCIPCVCDYNCTCNGQSLTCTARRVWCTTRTFTWTFKPKLNTNGIIMLSDVQDIRKNLNSEENARSCHRTGDNDVTVAGFVHDGMCTMQTTWSAINLYDYILYTDFLALKNAVNIITAKAGQESNLSGYSVISALFARHEIIYGSDIVQLLTGIDYSYIACICNSKVDCNCKVYCQCNSRCGSMCTTQGCGQCGCHGACSCVYYGGGYYYYGGYYYGGYSG